MNTTRMIFAAAVGAALAGPAMMSTAVAGTIAAGFDSVSMGRTDDDSTAAIGLGFTANFFGNAFDTVYVSNNGYLTFGRGQTDYRPQGLGSGYSGNPIIAPFYDDVDTRNPDSGITAYGTGTYNGHAAFGATWNGVGYWLNMADKLNTFQVILTDRSDLGAGDFDIYFNYGSIQWDATMDTTSAAVGFNAGNGAANSYFQAEGSLVAGAFVDGGPNALTGRQLAFTSRSGAPVREVPADEGSVPRDPILQAPVTVSDATINVPEPESFALIGLGIAAALVARRRKSLFGSMPAMATMGLATA